MNVAFFLGLLVVIPLALARPWSRMTVFSRSDADFAEVFQAETADEPGEPEVPEPRTYGVGGAIEVGS